jgi:hypothetical protein
LCKEGFDKQFAALGADHPTTLKTMHNLGYLYSQWGKFDKAEKLLVECTQKRTSLFGEHHYDTMESLTILVLLFDSQEKHAEQEPWLDLYHKGKIVEMTHLLGPECVSVMTKDLTLASLRKMGKTYYRTGFLSQNRNDLREYYLNGLK